MCVQAPTFTFTEPSQSKFWAWWNVALGFPFFFFFPLLNHLWFHLKWNQLFLAAFKASCWCCHLQAATVLNCVNSKSNIVLSSGSSLDVGSYYEYTLDMRNSVEGALALCLSFVSSMPSATVPPKYPALRTLPCKVTLAPPPHLALIRGTRAYWRNGLKGTLWNSIKINAKCCTWGGVTPYTSTCWAGLTALEAALQKRIWGLPLDKLSMSQQCALTAKNVCCVLGCINKSIASILEEIIIPLYSILCQDHIWSTVTLFGLPSIWWALTYCSEPSKGHQAGQRAGSTWWG